MLLQERWKALLRKFNATFWALAQQLLTHCWRCPRVGIVWLSPCRGWVGRGPRLARKNKWNCKRIEYEGKAKGRSFAEEENKIVMDECVGEVIYVQTRYIDMQKRVGPPHLCPHNMHRAELYTIQIHNRYTIPIHNIHNRYTIHNRHTIQIHNRYTTCTALLCIQAKHWTPLQRHLIYRKNLKDWTLQRK